MSKEANRELFEEGLKENNPAKIATALLSRDVLLFKIQNSFLSLFYEGSTESLDVLQEFFPYLYTSDLTTAFESACKKNTEFNKEFLERVFKSSVKVKSYYNESIIGSAKDQYGEEFANNVKNKILQEDMKYTITKSYEARDLEALKILFSDSSILKYLDDIFGCALNKCDFEVCDLLLSFMESRNAQDSFLSLLCGASENAEAKFMYLVDRGFIPKATDMDMDRSVKHYLFENNSKSSLSEDSISRLKAMYKDANPEFTEDSDKSSKPDDAAACLSVESAASDVMPADDVAAVPEDSYIEVMGDSYTNS